jgi:hypothetical protein
MIHAVAATLAVRVQFLPDVIDITVIPDATGTGGLMFALIGAMCGLEPDRLGRLTLLGNLAGGCLRRRPCS